MTNSEYQVEAARTMPTYNSIEARTHALLGLVAEAAEVYDAMQDSGAAAVRHTVLECGDVCWMIAELCTAEGLDLFSVVRATTPAKMGDWLEIMGHVAKLCGIYQKAYQGHTIDYVQVGDAVRTIWADVAGIAECLGATMGEVLDANIRKLRARYPEGFSAENSMHRKAGDL